MLARNAAPPFLGVASMIAAIARATLVLSVRTALLRSKIGRCHTNLGVAKVLAEISGPSEPGVRN